MKFFKIILWITVVLFSVQLLSIFFHLGQRIFIDHTLDKSDAIIAALGLFYAWVIRVLYKNFLKKNNSLIPQSSKTLNLSWSRFFIAACLISVMPILLIYINLSDRNWHFATVMLITLISLLLFMAAGWKRMQKANELKSTNPADTHQIIEQIIGPGLSAVIWFFTTFAVIAVVSALFMSAA
jgi:hypothetical protein